MSEAATIPQALRVEPFRFTLVRELTAPDLENMAQSVAFGEAIALAGPKPTLETIRHSHHQLARLLALGRPGVEISLITGYSPGYISRLRADPTFAELVSHYEGHVGELFADVLARARELQLVGMEELLARLTNNPEDWSKRELMELTKIVPLGGASAPAAKEVGGGPNIRIEFVASPHSAEVIELGRESVREIGLSVRGAD